MLEGLIQADLHCHTQCSDGSYTPRELVGKASKLGLSAVAITDHDTISGWEEAERAGREFQIEVLLGIELNTVWHGNEVHILGYGLNSKDEKLKKSLQNLSQAREKRMTDIVDRLNALGMEITLDQVKAFARGESVGRPHIAQALMAKGYVNSISEAFEKYLETGAPAYVDRYKLSTEEGIKLIREAGGVAVLAHPHFYLDEGIKGWIEHGLQGIEVYHPEHSNEETKHYFELAQNYNLIPTGGSDFHGEDRKPGALLGRWGVEMDIVRQLKSMSFQSLSRTLF